MGRISPYEIFSCGWCVYYCKHYGFCHRPFDYKVREYGDIACEHFHPKPEKIEESPSDHSETETTGKP